MSDVIVVENLTKRYGSFTAVDTISFTVKKGEVFAILGENGAGKTTTLEMIEGLRRPTSGHIHVLGHNTQTELRRVKEKIGVQLQSSAYYQYLTLKEILGLFGSYYPRSLAPLKLLKMVGLEEKANSLVQHMSGGQQQRFSIAAALVNDPDIVFLDEPTTGLDPVARRNLWELITDIKKQGKTVVLTTHYMEEAERLADRVAIMDHGTVKALDRTHKLIESLPHPFTVTFHTTLPAATRKKLEQLGQLETRGGKEDWFELKLERQEQLNETLAQLAKLTPESLTIGRATLEDVFIHLTGKTLEN